MYIKTLFKYNKVAAIAFVLFFASEIFINYKIGYVATPVLIFSMYSSPRSFKDTLSAQKLYVNGQLIKYTDLSIRENDALFETYDTYAAAAANNSSIYESFKKNLGKVHLQNFVSQANLKPPVTEEAYKTWYYNTVKKAIKQPINTLDLYEQKLLWDGNTLITVGSTKLLLHAGTE